MDELELTGRARSHITQVTAPRFAAHHQVVAPFMAMRAAAAADGIDLRPFSSFRDFDTQLRIWNKKFLGEKPLYDQNGQVRIFNTLSTDEIIDCILNWSALPGASRHHWGTEIDVVDGSAVPADYVVKLLPEETAPGGVFHRLHLWLDQHAAEFGFYRPYDRYRGGMYAEPWHLSFTALSSPALEQMSVDLLQRTLADVALQGKDRVLQRLPDILAHHVRNVAEAPKY